MKATKNYIWDYDLKKLDLKNEEVLLWYLKRKIEYGDWEVLDRKTLRKYLLKLEIDLYLKQILRKFLRKKIDCLAWVSNTIFNPLYRIIGTF